MIDCHLLSSVYLKENNWIQIIIDESSCNNCSKDVLLRKVAEKEIDYWYVFYKSQKIMIKIFYKVQDKALFEKLFEEINECNCYAELHTFLPEVHQFGGEVNWFNCVLLLKKCSLLKIYNTIDLNDIYSLSMYWLQSMDREIAKKTLVNLVQIRNIDLTMPEEILQVMNWRFEQTDEIVRAIKMQIGDEMTLPFVFIFMYNVLDLNYSQQVKVIFNLYRRFC